MDKFKDQTIDLPLVRHTRYQDVFHDKCRLCQRTGWVNADQRCMTCYYDGPPTLSRISLVARILNLAISCSVIAMGVAAILMATAICNQNWREGNVAGIIMLCAVGAYLALDGIVTLLSNNRKRANR